MSKLLFIDTNIYLDFYRIRNEVKLPFLAHLEAIKDRLIMTDQVEMEFKKNRQAAILEGMRGLKAPNKISVPGLLREDRSAKALYNDVEKIEKRLTILRTRLENVLEKPAQSDKVYQCLQRLFAKKEDIDLYRKSPKRHDIRELAQKRFILGYPPKKKNDTSIGDAINWEWVVHVATKKNADIWIVSRDSDYGVSHSQKGFINDWLRQEFEERLPEKRNVVLCTLLSHALKQFEVTVTEEEELEEEKIASQPSSGQPKRGIDRSVFPGQCPECGIVGILLSIHKDHFRYLCPDCGSVSTVPYS